MEGRGGAAQTAFLLEQSCDVLLLTEVKDGWTLPGYSITEGGPDMGPGKRWAAIASREPLVPLGLDPLHPASVAAVVGCTTYVSSILPWAGSGGKTPWHGVDHAARVVHTLKVLAPFLQDQKHLVWGGATGTIPCPVPNGPGAGPVVWTSWPLSTISVYACRRPAYRTTWPVCSASTTWRCEAARRTLGGWSPRRMASASATTTSILSSRRTARCNAGGRSRPVGAPSSHPSRAAGVAHLGRALRPARPAGEHKPRDGGVLARIRIPNSDAAALSAADVSTYR